MKYLYHHRTQGLNVEGVHVRSICKALVSQGHQVRLVSVTSTDDQFTRDPLQKTENHKNENTGVLKYLAKKLPEPLFELLEIGYNLYSFVRLWSVIHFDRPERIYERYSLFLFSTLILAKLYRIPIVYEVNDSTQLERLRPLYFKSIATWIEKKVFTKASGLVFVSERLKEIIEAAYSLESHSVVTPNASEKAVFYYDETLRESSKKALNLQKQIVCGFIGCFARWHGVHHFISKLAPKLKNHPNLTLLLVGDGETLQEVRSIVEKNDLSDQVILTGNVPHADIINYIRSMDLSILPSSNEYGSPMKIFELMGTGVPIVAADYPPVQEIIVDKIDGWMFPRGNFDACIDTLLDVYNKKDTLHKVAVAAESKIHRHHQWTDNTEQLEALYGSTINSVT